MEEEIRALRKQLAESQAAHAESDSIARALASPLLGGTEEQATGKTVMINMCLNPAERDEKKQKFKDIEYPTYFYHIDLPVGAGQCLTTNGTEFFHGQTYEVDPMVLSDLKSRVAQCWKHEKSIHSENENAYRKPQHTSLISAAARARGGH